LVEHLTNCPEIDGSNTPTVQPLEQKRCFDKLAIYITEKAESQTTKVSGTVFTTLYFLYTYEWGKSAIVLRYIRLKGFLLTNTQAY
jgi:hypothetical protein